MSEGWHEFITPVKALTRIAYVYESGEVYLPEGGDPDDFVLAASYGRVYRLVREDEAAAQPPAPITAEVLAGLREEMQAVADEWHLMLKLDHAASAMETAIALVEAAQQRLADRGQGGGSDG